MGRSRPTKRGTGAPSKVDGPSGSTKTLLKPSKAKAEGSSNWKQSPAPRSHVGETGPPSKVDGPTKTAVQQPKSKAGPSNWKQSSTPRLLNGETGPPSKLNVPTKTVVQQPKSKADASSNWKQLSTALPAPAGGGRRGRNHRPRKPRFNRSKPEDPPKSKDVPLVVVEGNTNAYVVKPPTPPAVILNAFGFPAYDKDGRSLTPGPLPWGLMHHTRAIAIDCEMVGVGPNGVESALARIALVNESGYCLYHKFVKPKLPVTDYRTHVSGIRPEDLANGDDIHFVMNEVASILKGHILVGHGVNSDLKVLFLRHPRYAIRDTSYYFKRGFQPKLSRLVSDHLGVTIQSGEHSPIEDAQAVMKLYLRFKAEWEDSVKFFSGR